MRHSYRAAVLAAACTILTACAELPQQMDQVADNLRKLGQNVSAPIVPSGPTAFSQSGLANVFKGTETASKWPRVALTIDNMPPDAANNWFAWQAAPVPAASVAVAPANYCITISAVVWRNEKSSQRFDHIPYCGRDAKVRDITDDYTFTLLGWAQMPKNAVKNTGASRSFGPNPPLKSFPSRSIIIDTANSRASFMFAHLLMSMGLDLTVDYLHENRLWVVSTVQ
ncbi:hypothetical protein [Burkholderia diffusa]|uniref:hypothetical protein n=1 Tax=Burkholderia diffusa TaxID=488732 RepID=UPI000756040E|nr:hypothetical protein [Burkholderia diffusa]KVH42037.1 hypothetical protein WJ39_02490 [Burkholderia diffusa]